MIELGPLTDKLEELVLAQVGSALAGNAKMDKVIADAKAWLDGKLVFRGPAAGALEAISDVLIAALPVRQIAQAIFESLRQAGRA